MQLKTCSWRAQGSLPYAGRRKRARSAVFPNSALAISKSSHSYTERQQGCSFPDVSTLSPADATTVTSETPNFSWDQVTYPGTIIAYRLDTTDEQNKPIHSTILVAAMRSHKVLEGVLTVGKTYRWLM